MSYLVENPEDRFSRDEAHIILCPKDGDGMANSLNLIKLRSSPIWVYTVFPGLSI